MARQLDQVTETQITQKNITAKFVFKINNVDYTYYVLDWALSYNTQFGSATASFTLDNNQGIFGSGGLAPLNVGDVVSLIEQYEGSSQIWKSFYGKIEQRSISNTANSRTMSLVCLDYISVLKQWDIDLKVDGTKIEIEDEIMVPQFLPSPNQMFAQVFNFANNAIADNPRPIFTFRDKAQLTEDPQYDGFDVYYNVGQVKLGAPLQALNNYDLVAKSYFFYTEGVFCEDVLEAILTQEDGYGGYLFGETSAADVITNHLTTTFLEEEYTTTDYMTPNYTTSTVVVRHKLTSAINVGDSHLVLDSVEGFPNSGQASVNGDIFTWTHIDSGNVLGGIPVTTSYALSAHPVGSVVQYSSTYPSGQVWYLKYSNIITDLVNANFTIPGATVSYFDKRNGRIILNTNINLTYTVTCDVDYTFKTLQTSGVELNSIEFRPRELANRYEAIDKLRKYLAPNYIIRTQGDEKIWSGFMYQKVVPDYTLNLVTSVNYMEEEDLYTRVVLYGKNNNPTNLMFNENISFGTTGASYKAYASQSELIYDKTVDGYTYWNSAITNAGRILLDTYTPILYINGLPVDNKLHQVVSQPVKIQMTTRTETTTTTSSGKGAGAPETSVKTYYYYKILFLHQSIEPSQEIIIYDLHGYPVYTIMPNDGGMDYGNAVYSVPGSAQNIMVETISTASYWILYSTNNINIDYDNVVFKISSQTIPDPTRATVEASFQYYAVFTPARGAAAIIDGRWDTQVQTEFYAEPPSGYEYSIIDFGSIQTIQALDVVAGFYKPDDIRKFDIDFRFSVLYSLNGTDYYEIGDKTHNVQLTGGASVTFEESDLGVGFQARYFKIILDNVKKIPYGAVKDSSGRVLREGIWVVAISEVSAYGNIILRSEAKLIPTTKLTQNISGTTIYVTSTDGFEEPGSGETATAYINNLAYKAFTYTYLTSTTFEGVTLISGCSGLLGDTVSQTITTSNDLVDPDGLLPQLGDRLYKRTDIDEKVLYDQTNLDQLSGAFLREFYKNHTKLTVDVIYAPHLKLGQTISLTDSYNYINNGLYFIEAISTKPTGYQLTIGRYPA